MYKVKTLSVVESLKKEFARKAIHMSVAFVPFLANDHYYFTVALLTAGILFYTVSETLRIKGRSTIISRITSFVARPQESGFVWGPVTLGFGALTALLYYPNPAATVAIYALAFGDGFASVAGNLIGKKALFRIGQKTLTGSFACFTAVFASSYFVLKDIKIALAAAFTATILEILPTGDLDNILIPLGTGFLVTTLL